MGDELGRVSGEVETVRHTDRGIGMRVLHRSENGKSNRALTTAANETQGLAGWIFCLLQNWRGQREAQKKQLRLVETLPLGGKRQLMLVTCAGESFLVGGGVESVETIVRLKAQRHSEEAGQSRDGSCR